MQQNETKPVEPKIEPELLDTEQAANFVNVSMGKLHQMRFRGEGPPYVVFSKGAIRYRISDLREYNAARVVIPGQDERPDLPRRRGGPGRPRKLRSRVRNRSRQRAA